MGLGATCGSSPVVAPSTEDQIEWVSFGWLWLAESSRPSPPHAHKHFAVFCCSAVFCCPILRVQVLPHLRSQRNLQVGLRGQVMCNANPVMSKEPIVSNGRCLFTWPVCAGLVRHQAVPWIRDTRQGAALTSRTTWKHSPAVACVLCFPVSAMS